MCFSSLAAAPILLVSMKLVRLVEWLGGERWLDCASTPARRHGNHARNVMGARGPATNQAPSGGFIPEKQGPYLH